MKRYEKRAARRYAHMTPWRPCWRYGGGPTCPRCLWRVLTGRMRRDFEAHLAKSRAGLERVRACPHDQREPFPNHPHIEWRCRSCGAVNWNRKETA